MKNSTPILMLLIACAVQNVSTGTSYGSYGVILNDLIGQFGISHSMASLGLALLALIAGLSGPLVGRLIDGWSLRGTVIIGALMGSAGLALAGIATNFYVFLIGFSLISGFGSALAGAVPGSTLAGRWFPSRTGLAVAVANLALLISIGPPVYAWITVHFGWRTLMFGLSSLYLLLLLPVFFIKNHPAAATTTVAAPAGAKFRFSDVARDRAFWLVTISTGILFGTAISLSSHIIAFAIERGVPVATASWLLSFVGIFAMVGGLLFGWISDRVGAVPTLAANAALNCIGWFLLGMGHSFTPIALCVVVLGLCGGGLLAPLGAFIAQRYGASAFGSILGLVTQLILPMTFGGTILVGVLYDTTHNYQVPFTLLSGLCGLACILFLLLIKQPGPARTAASV
ncbi:MAG: putative MFS-type transporter YcxA [Verrucomicrobiaceae bacterium]|nr:putative MFS-type transporter YcxA [Verrucomicrobiaceae bacterium]